MLKRSNIMNYGSQKAVIGIMCNMFVTGCTYVVVCIFSVLFKCMYCFKNRFKQFT